MRFTYETASEGVLEQNFLLGQVPGVLWTSAGADGTRPLVVVGHGGGEHKNAPFVAALARRLVAERAYAVLAIDAPSHGDRPDHEEFTCLATDYETRLKAGADLAPVIARFQALVVREIVPEWQAVLHAVQKLSHVGPGPVGYWGLSLGCVIGVPFVAAEPRVRAAVLGLAGGEVSADAAARVTVPVEFLICWNDQRVARSESMALFDALASKEKTLRANPGVHGQIPPFEIDGTLRFLARHRG